MSMSTPHHGERAVVVSMIDMTTGVTRGYIAVLALQYNKTTTGSAWSWWGSEGRRPGRTTTGGSSWWVGVEIFNSYKETTGTTPGVAW